LVHRTPRVGRSYVGFRALTNIGRGTQCACFGPLRRPALQPPCSRPPRLLPRRRRPPPRRWNCQTSQRLVTRSRVRANSASLAPRGSLLRMERIIPSDNVPSGSWTTSYRKTLFAPPGYTWQPDAGNCTGYGTERLDCLSVASQTLTPPQWRRGGQRRTLTCALTRRSRASTRARARPRGLRGRAHRPMDHRVAGWLSLPATWRR